MTKSSSGGCRHRRGHYQKATKALELKRLCNKNIDDSTLRIQHTLQLRFKLKCLLSSADRNGSQKTIKR
ncbi:hypothetical protein L596_001788 [Steinernema carpocapsae]|uniref:Uncharacterized protein n=1 Tax=Steinernema carpocapsae TaxID=34508 RepID=A0A4U8UR58_STECR|nr:hypothetical protein L596_001788 [Steinernema carpocapsae]